MFINKLTELKTLRKLTNQQISDLSGVPLSTVTRIFNGQTENPNIQTIVDIVKAMDGSMDEVMGLRIDVKKEPDDRLIQLYQETLRSKDKYIKVLASVLIGIIGVLLFILIYDIMNGNIGYVRY